MTHTYARDPQALTILKNLNSPTNRTVGGPNVPAVFPTPMRNTAKVAALRRLLGLESTDADVSQADLESAYRDVLSAKSQAEIAPEIVKGEYGVRAARERATAAESQRARNEKAAFERQQQQLNAAMERAKLTQTGETTRLATRQAFERSGEKAPTGNIPQQYFKAIEAARGLTGGPLDFLSRKLGRTPASDVQYRGALEALFTRQGTLPELQKAAQALRQYKGSLAAATADPTFEFDLSNMTQNEADWLRLVTGK